MAFPFLEKMVSYSYVRRWYFDPKTNRDIYLEYESYVTTAPIWKMCFKCLSAPEETR